VQDQTEEVYVRRVVTVELVSWTASWSRRRSGALTYSNEEMEEANASGIPPI
jgi:hypothetical protein